MSQSVRGSPLICGLPCCPGNGIVRKERISSRGGDGAATDDRAGSRFFLATSIGGFFVASAFAAHPPRPAPWSGVTSCGRFPPFFSRSSRSRWSSSTSSERESSSRTKSRYPGEGERGDSRGAASLQGEDVAGGDVLAFCRPSRSSYWEGRFTPRACPVDASDRGDRRRAAPCVGPRRRAPVFAENNRLMEDPRGYAGERSTRRQVHARRLSLDDAEGIRHFASRRTHQELIRTRRHVVPGRRAAPRRRARRIARGPSGTEGPIHPRPFPSADDTTSRRPPGVSAIGTSGDGTSRTAVREA